MVDFLDVSWFAAFNLADVAIVCGVAVAALLIWKWVPAFGGDDAARRTGRPPRG